MKGVRLLVVAALAVALIVGAGCTTRRAPQGFTGLVSGPDLLYASGSGGTLIAMDTQQRAADAAFPSGSEWDYDITTQTKGLFGCGASQAGAIIYGTPVLDGGKLCVGTYEGKVLMLDPESRRTGAAFPQSREGEWQYPRSDEDTIGPIVGAPTIVGDTVYVCSSTRQGGQTVGLVYALDREFGDELWVSPPLDGKLWVSPAVVDGVVYVTTFDGHVYTLSAETGQPGSWSYTADVGFVSSPLVQDGIVFAGSFDRTLYALEPGSNQPLWTYEAGNWFWATPTVSGNVLYAPNLDGHLYALDLRSGNEAWSFDAGSPIAAGAAIVGNSIVVVTKDGDVFVVDAANGTGVRIANPENENATTLNATVIAAPCVHQGLVYVLPQDNIVYAIDPVAKTIEFQFSLTME